MPRSRTVYERRKHRRFPSSLAAKAEMESCGRIHTAKAWLRNISNGGVFMLLEGQTELGDSIDIQINDVDESFSRRLGIDAPLDLKLLGAVVRIEREKDNSNLAGVAMQFISPARFMPTSGRNTGEEDVREKT